MSKHEFVTVKCYSLSMFNCIKVKYFDIIPVQKYIINVYVCEYNFCQQLLVRGSQIYRYVFISTAQKWAMEEIFTTDRKW